MSVFLAESKNDYILFFLTSEADTKQTHLYFMLYALITRVVQRIETLIPFTAIVQPYLAKVSY
jgi:hypothetical protein